ncbi:hypothetical protein [Aquimarina sp. SS2-1]|uniref:hypothetical protein n=1 Tax=Aquimarina besae TaxID=3342247 RepID=UPI0036706A50
MKTKNNFFKNLSKVVLVLSILMIASCGSDDDGAVDAGVILPAELVTTYDGSLTYAPTNGTTIINTSGTATITRSGNSYTISFSDGVPSITGVTFIQTGDTVFVSASVGTPTSGIAINDAELSVGITIDGNVWTFGTN